MERVIIYQMGWYGLSKNVYLGGWHVQTDGRTTPSFCFRFFFFYHNKRKKFSVYGVVRLTSQRSLYSTWLRRFKSTFRNAMQLKLLITAYSKPLFFL